MKFLYSYSDVFIADSLFTSATIQMIKLKHPRTAKPAVYVFDKDNNRIFDLVAFDEGHRYVITYL